MTLPEFRDDVSIHVEEEGGDHYLVLQDAFGYAEGPIMVHSDMLQIIEACNGITTYSELAEAAEVDIDSKEMMRLKAFVSKLSEMGYLHDATFEARKKKAIQEFLAADVRQPIYVREATDISFSDIEHLLSNTKPPAKTDTFPASLASETGTKKIKALLIPHIDFRVATDAYQHAIQVLSEVESDVFVIVGTSHYWYDTPVVLTTKDFIMGGTRVTTHKEIVADLAEKLGTLNSASDIAHKPEHSIEMHVALLKLARGERPFSIVPILIAGGAHSETEISVMRQVADIVKGAIQTHAPNAFWMISGDLAHVGLKFGDELRADEISDAVQKADADILKSLENVDIAAYIKNSTLPELNQRICGLGPTAVVLGALQPAAGTVLHYGVWEEEETGSAVSYATVQF